MRNLATVLQLKAKLPEKFQHFSAIDGSIKMLNYSRISKNFNVKSFKIFYEAQAVSYLKEVIQTTTSKKLLTEIYRITQTFAFPVFRECSSWASRNGAVQIYFSDTNQKHICWKICKVSGFLAVLREYIFENVE